MLPSKNTNYKILQIVFNFLLSLSHANMTNIPMLRKTDTESYIYIDNHGYHRSFINYFIL